MVNQDFFIKLKKWIEEEFQEVQVIDNDANPGKVIQFKFARGSMAIAFERVRPKKATILRGISIDEPHQKALDNLDDAYRRQLRHDLSYEFSSYNIPFNTNYDANNILQTIQFSTSVFDDNLTKNYFIERVFRVFNAGFRVIAYINKELN